MSVPDKVMKLKDGKILYDDLRERTENVIAVQDETPSAGSTKIWLPETQPTPVQVPTYAEHQALENKLPVVPRFTFGIDMQTGDATITCNMTYAEVSALTSSGKCTNAMIVYPEGIPIPPMSLDFVQADAGNLIFMYIVPASLESYSGGNDVLSIIKIIFKSDETVEIARGSINIPDSLAIDFDDLTYPVAEGTLCYYGGNLWKADQTIATKEEFTRLHWTRTTVETELNNLKAYTDAKDALIAPVEADSFADNAYAVGQVFVYNGKLYKATSAIAIGDPIVPNTNCTETNVFSNAVTDVRVNGASVLNNGVANIPVASYSTPGVVYLNADYGIYKNSSGMLNIQTASSSMIKSGVNIVKPITASNQHESTFYGMAKAAGDATQSASNNAVGTYTAEAKAAIQAMLNVPDESEVSDLNSALSGKAPVIVNSVSGAIASFSDGIGGEPLVDCVVQIEPVQSGSGDPAPDNVRPISGWTGCTVRRTGKNLSSVTEYANNPNIFWGGDYSDLRAMLNTLPAGTYTLSNKYKVVTLPTSVKVTHGSFLLRDRAGNNINAYSVATDNSPAVGKVYNESTTFTITEAVAGNIDKCYFYCDANDHTAGRGTYNLYDIQIELGSTATAYEPYIGTVYPISWQTEAGTVYGGSLDVTTGVLTVTHRFATFNGSEAWTGNSGSTYFALWNQAPSKSNDDLTQIANWLIGGGGSYQTYGKFRVQTNGALCVGNAGGIWDDANAFKTYLASNPLQVCYELSEPQTYQLTPIEITAITESNMWADCGGTEVSYKADTKGYVDNHSGGQQITVDSALSSTSTNPVQNKVINTALAGKEPKHAVTTVSGSTPSITGVANTQYKCGEVVTLSITPPASGCIDVIFTSGSTPTVLTVTPQTGMTMRWANGFDPTALEANTTYEINILDGCLGVAGTWT